MAVTTRSYAGNRFYLELDKPSGWLFTAEGGQPSTDLITERLAGGYPSRKHVGIVKFEDITVTCGTGMTEQFYQWLQQSLRYEHQRRNGAIVSANYDYKEVARQDFHQALITEIGFPGLDASSKDTAKFNIKYAVEWTEMKYSNGAQSIRAVVTDSLARTAEDVESTTVSKFKPKALNLNSKRIGNKKLRIKAYGKLVLPARMTAADGCSASRVGITAKLGKKSLVNKQIKLASDCTYGLAFGAPKTKKKQRVVITVRFAGNDSLSAISQVRKVR